SASSLTADNEVRFVPVSRYGVQVSEFIASLN
ncbi:TPA: fimbrial chaperone protein, partial [Citrobacter freundii]|nr:fimbrial chaperone protein [Citrobacter freundii]